MIKILKEPQVSLVIKPSIDWESFNKFLENNYNTTLVLDEEGHAHKSHDGDMAPMLCGKSCYKAWAVGRKNPREYLKHIIESGHGSVLEHANFGFVVISTRAIINEVLRHRAGWAYSQESQRFCDERENAFIMPKSIQGQVLSEDIWTESMQFAQERYIQLVDNLMGRYKNHEDYKDLSPTDLRKKVREAARGVLPNDTASVIHMTGNIRAIRHFLEMRSSKHAEVGIRMVADKLYEIMLKECPILFGDYTKVSLPDGTFELTTQFTKV